MSTDQGAFWAGEFGNDYIDRNNSKEFLASNIHFFSKIFSHLSLTPKSFIEFGANIGVNGQALKLLFPKAQYTGVEINAKAVEILRETADAVVHSSIENYEVIGQHSVSFSKGVLIHLNPASLSAAYEKLYKSSERWILIAEYYNPTPVGIPYRGFSDRLFKRDFAGELMAMYPDLNLLGSGFSYHLDMFPQDDISWFLMEKSK
jgi:pseudaminic acid biosynthesis-associated methylase